MAASHVPEFLWDLFQKLNRRQFMLGLDDYHALRQALRAGFGWSSRQALCDLCVALWAKSDAEGEIVRTLLAQVEPTDLGDWELPRRDQQPSIRPPVEAKGQSPDATDTETAHSVAETPPSTIVTQPYRGSSTISLSGVPLSSRRFAFLPQFPLTQRHVAQAWRRLRRPARFGPRTELDVDATLDARARSGLPTPPVLVPRRRNTVRMLLLVDRQGSMTPFHHFVEEVTTAIRRAGGLEQVSVYYFHDIPGGDVEMMPLEALQGQFFPVLDTVLPDIPPTTEGDLYADPALTELIPLEKVLSGMAHGTATVLISDAGAARGRYDAVRLLETVAFLKGLRQHTPQYVWLNPVPPEQWTHTTAAQIARHAPMFALDQRGMYGAVNVLRGQPHPLEQPL